MAAGGAGAAEKRHGLSIFGDLKYPAGFRHFEYVNPDAPKGGEFRSWSVETYDSLNPFILRGIAPRTISESFGVERTFTSLLSAAADEPDSAYGLAAESIERSADGRSITFNIREIAKFHDGTPITAEDVVWTFDTLRTEGHPRYRIVLRDVERAVAEGPKRVRFDFAPNFTRDLPPIVGSLPILSKAHFGNRTFNETTLVPLLGSGPYRVERVDPGRSITYRRVEDWWGKDLPVNRGRFNFDTIRYDFFRDRDVALEAFFAGAYDWREEFTSRSWATGYDRPAVREGRILRRELPDHSLSGFQAYFLNMRRERFADRRVREAISHAFDYEWTNKTIFYSLYDRTTSVFPNSEMASAGRPGPGEMRLLEPLRGKVPGEVFGEPYRPPSTDGSGNSRDNLRRAQELLREAGWQVREGRLVHGARGEAMRIEFLMYERSFERVNAPFIANLKRLGIEATMRLVDPAQYQNRMRDYDFDIIVQRYAMPQTPGVEQRNFWHSDNRDTPGMFNLAGVGDPAVDALVEAMIAAKSRTELIDAARALDRVIMWNVYAIPQWNKAAHHIAFWDKFAWPAVKPRYGLAVVDTWWVDPAKEAALGR
ncbi:MAG: ABC transporter substrate-binding protein [Alphaproteobacteria bacterium]|nr:ABC transporter substrate-binding protein [Alphaproteobacteria bacterium]